MQLSQLSEDDDEFEDKRKDERHCLVVMCRLVGLCEMLQPRPDPRCFAQKLSASFEFIMDHPLSGLKMVDKLQTSPNANSGSGSPSSSRILGNLAQQQGGQP